LVKAARERANGVGEGGENGRSALEVGDARLEIHFQDVEASFVRRETGLSSAVRAGLSCRDSRGTGLLLWRDEQRREELELPCAKWHFISSYSRVDFLEQLQQCLCPIVVVALRLGLWWPGRLHGSVVQALEKRR
jgi:hypothetical protein